MTPIERQYIDHIKWVCECSYSDQWKWMTANYAAIDPDELGNLPKLYAAELAEHARTRHGPPRPPTRSER